MIPYIPDYEILQAELNGPPSYESLDQCKQCYNRRRLQQCETCLNNYCYDCMSQWRELSEKYDLYNEMESQATHLFTCIFCYIDTVWDVFRDDIEEMII